MRPNSPRCRPPARLLAAVGLLLLAAGGASARIVVPADEAQADLILPVLARIETAVRAGDHEALAGLLSAHGVRLSLGPVAERTSDLTPSQAFYVFKTLFQDRQTVAFVFEKHQEVDGGRLHAVAVWEYTTPANGPGTRQRVLFTLAHEDGAHEDGAHEDGGWKVTEITAWR